MCFSRLWRGLGHGSSYFAVGTKSRTELSTNNTVRCYTVVPLTVTAEPLIFDIHRHVGLELMENCEFHT